ncbi:hypothetical protein [Vreelandella zhanjiangensis]|uniref:hypothetical protein n=1 Tax=Vreelandella zhanjiangensis TaxID=1121960 RepID=UPI000377B4A9|nr:hypothetical protein [Halomonas zhanjiangensis]
MKPAFFKPLFAWIFIALLGMIVLLGLLHLKNGHSPGPQLTFSKESTTHLTNATRQANIHLMEVRQRLARLSSDIDQAATTLSQTRDNLEHASQAVQELDLPSHSAQRPLIDAMLDTYKRLIDNPLQRYLDHFQTFRNATNAHLSAVSKTMVNVDRNVLEWANQLTSSEQKDSRIVLMTVALLIALAGALYIAFKGAIHVFVVRPLQRAAQAQNNVLNDSPALSFEEYGDNTAGYGYSAVNDRQPTLAAKEQAPDSTHISARFSPILLEEISTSTAAPRDHAYPSERFSTPAPSAQPRMLEREC